MPSYWLYVNRPNAASVIKTEYFCPNYTTGEGKKIRRGTGEISPPAHQAIQNVFERELHGGLTGRSGASTSPGQLGSRAIGIGQELVSQEVEVWLKVEVLRYWYRSRGRDLYSIRGLVKN